MPGLSKLVGEAYQTFLPGLDKHKAAKKLQLLQLNSDLFVNNPANLAEEDFEEWMINPLDLDPWQLEEQRVANMEAQIFTDRFEA